MPYSHISYTGDGHTQVFAVPFSYAQPCDVQVAVDGIPTPFEWSTANSIKLSIPPLGGSSIELLRNTGIKEKAATYTLGASLTTKTLNANADQVLMKLQEQEDRLEKCLTLSRRHLYHAKGAQVRGVGNPLDPTDATNKKWVRAN